MSDEVPELSAPAASRTRFTVSTMKAPYIFDSQDGSIPVVFLLLRFYTSLYPAVTYTCTRTRPRTHSVDIKTLTDSNSPTQLRKYKSLFYTFPSLRPDEHPRA